MNGYKTIETAEKLTIQDNEMELIYKTKNSLN